MQNNNKKIIIEKEKSQKKSISTACFDDSFYELDKQIEFIKNLDQNKILHPEIYKNFNQQIKTKINSYKSQDKIKNLYNESLFIDLEYILSLLKEVDFKCYYCDNFVKIFYKHVRESDQWSIERIDNNFGHNKNNVTIACLNCNLKRKTMYHERYKFTKQLQVIKKENN